MKVLELRTPTGAGTVLMRSCFYLLTIHAPGHIGVVCSHVSSGVASIANEVKWVSVGCGFISVLCLFVYNSLQRAKSHQH